MPLPAALWAGASWPDHPNCHVGPFEVGGALYAVALDKVNNHLEVGKSTDGGNTWAEVDAANHKPITTTAGLKSAAACLDGTTLAIAYKADTNAGYMALFDTTTDTWGAASSIGTANVFADVTGKMPLALVARAPGDYVYVYIGQPDSIMGTGYDRVSIARYSSGAWQTFGVKVESPGTQIHQAFGGAVLGSSGRVHIYYRDRTNNILRHNALLTTNGFGGASTIDASVAAGNYPLGLATSYVDGADTKIVVPYADATSGDLMAGRFTSADAPTFTSQAVSDLVVSTPEMTASNPGAAAADGTTVHLFWPNDLDQDIYHSNDGGTGTWVTDAEHRDAVAVAGISIAKISGAIGLLYDNGGTVTFDTHSLGGGAPTTHTGTSAQTLPSLVQSAAGTADGPLFSGAAAQTLPALAQTAAGTSGAPVVGGAVAQALPSLTQSAAGTRTVPAFTGTAAQTLPSLAQSASGAPITPTFTGSAAQTLPAATQSATGATTAPVFSATAAQSLPSLNQAAASTHVAPVFTGTAAQPLPAIAQSAAGTVAAPSFTATAAQTLPQPTQGAAGATAPPPGGFAAQDLPALTQAGSGTHVPPTLTGSAAQTLPAISQTTTGSTQPPTYIASVAQTLPVLSQSATSTSTLPASDGTTSQILPALTQTATGGHAAPTFTATISQTLPSLTQLASRMGRVGRLESGGLALVSEGYTSVSSNESSGGIPPLESSSGVRDLAE